MEKGAVVTFTALIAALAALSALAALAHAATVDLSPAGDAAVTFEVNVTEAPAYLEFRALGKPVVARALLNGANVPVEFNETHIMVFADEPGLLAITYVTQELTSKEGSLWVLSAEFAERSTVILPEGAVPTHVEPEPLRVLKVDDRFALEVPAGSATIRYYIVPPSVVPPPTRPANVTAPPPGEKAPAAAPAPPWLPMAALAAIALACGIAFVALRRRRRSKHPLDEREAAILEALSKHGPLTPQELIEVTRIPKTPLFRRLKRLKEAGLVKARLDDKGRVVYERA